MIDVGLIVGGYEILRRAAVGAMGTVYEGRDPRSGRRVALKVLHDAWCMDAEVIARFLNEARTLARIRHRRVVTVLEWGSLPAGPPFMVMEWLPENLHAAMTRAGGPLPQPVMVRVGAQIAEALEALHERGIVHRDLKPANVLMELEDLAVAEFRLGDLGLAKIRPEQAIEPGLLENLPISTGGSALLGTWDYMAPEQWMKSKDVHPKTDVYALGVLLFQMASGRLPFVAEQPKDLMCFHLFESPPLGLLQGTISPAGSDLISSMLSKTALQRPTMQEVLERLRAMSRACAR